MQPRLTTTVSILSLSTVTGITTAITGIIPQLKRAFPRVPTTLIEWVVTIANCSALITLLLNPRLTNRWGLRPVVISGLLLSAVMGLIPAFTANFTVIMLSRLGLGLGVGLFSPHAISLLTHSFTGELRARLLGYQTGLSALGNAVLLGLAGLLIGISWHAVFWLYGGLVIIAGLVARFVPEPTSAAPVTTTEQASLPRHQWLLLGLTFITYLLIWGVQLKLPSFFAARHFGNAATINLTLAAMNIGGLLAGLTFGYLHRILHRYTLTLGYAGAAGSVLILWLAPNATIAIGAAVFFNFIYSYTGPYLVFTSNTGLDASQVNVLSSYLTIATIISAFFAPLVWNGLGQLGPQSLTANVLIWIMLILGGLAVLTATHHSRKEV
ncbi:MFS transporter [Lactiplantibacillus pentosus]|uniref:Transport protein n=1 Tax=Lactiplantibacillus pentosus DSM 20314 TaxID=1423791 RepID=A0A837RCX0_LACPE|nr:MFS transporter [Lactiplantibacillus pentosus]AYJ40767.1 MFS transporter [Lactiplantibacillus pentosus]KRK25764.1 transport protein [Lactiplantibacillus pentosus DSM 20314]MCC3161908.1 MFS transporter [Lactiplantibacillus pentosus]MCJ8187853.1 MFS transporter [Lactiplantibacillus pentosus]MCT3313404.1 MFS transporter [Lactiplantibacillus pentosus]